MQQRLTLKSGWSKLRRAECSHYKLRRFFYVISLVENSPLRRYSKLNYKSSTNPIIVEVKLVRINSDKNFTSVKDKNTQGQNINLSQKSILGQNFILCEKIRLGQNSNQAKIWTGAKFIPHDKIRLGQNSSLVKNFPGFKIYPGQLLRLGQ